DHAARGHHGRDHGVRVARQARGAGGSGGEAEEPVSRAARVHVPARAAPRRLLRDADRRGPTTRPAPRGRMARRAARAIRPRGGGRVVGPRRSASRKRLRGAARAGTWTLAARETGSSASPPEPPAPRAWRATRTPWSRPWCPRAAWSRRPPSTPHRTRWRRAAR